MKIAAIGDIHGRTIWKDIVKMCMDYDKIIFLGDYVDPYEEYRLFKDFIRLYKPSEEECFNNLKEILEFKKQYPDKVELLLGNHDYQYLFWSNENIESTDRFDLHYATHYSTFFEMNKEYFKMAWQHENLLFTHAGVSNGWFECYYNIIEQNGLNEDETNIAETLNNMMNDYVACLYLYTNGEYRNGDDEFAGPLWAHIYDVDIDFLKGYHQFVGHNKVKFIDRRKIQLVNDSSITFCDVLHTPNKNLKYNFVTINTDDYVTKTDSKKDN